MSRVGKLPVIIPDGVKVSVADGVVSVEGGKGKLNLPLTDYVSVEVNDNEILVNPVNETREARAMWGTTRSNISNMVEGVSKGFEIKLELVGVGYRAQVTKKHLNLFLGYSHNILYELPEGIEIKCDKQTNLTISGYDKQQVGQVAAEIRSIRKPEPYKGKGVRYIDRPGKGPERVRSKVGKKK